MKLQNADFFEAARICTAPGEISDCDACPLNNWRIEKEGENPSCVNYNLCIDYLISELTAIAKQYTCRTCDFYDAFSGVCCNGDSAHCADFIDCDNTCKYWTVKIQS